jgi:hypothetical protein
MKLNVNAQTSFIKEICSYYMDFLKSGFKSSRFPKRYLRISDEKGYKIGIDLSKYEKFNLSLKKKINKEKGFGETINVNKGDFGVKLNNTSQDLIKKLVKQISEKDIERIVNLTNKTIKDYSVTYRTKPDEAYEIINETIKYDLDKIIVDPICEKMDPLIGSQSNYEIESQNTLRLRLSESILDPLTEGIPYIFNDILANKKIKPKDKISELFNKTDISNNLLNSFQNLDVKDLYYDLREIAISRRNLDKKETYLNIFHIEIEGKVFPLFYTQINISENSGSSKFKIEPSSELFINKAAIKYAFDVLKKDKNIIEYFEGDRKFYISEIENLSELINEVVVSLISKLRLDGSIDLNKTDPQLVVSTDKSSTFKISNNFSISVADKSDEALINDYEEILEMFNGSSSEIVDMFKKIISDFLLNEPEVITEDLADKWDGMSVSERLNYVSPIPLNSEQQKIIRALKNEKCKYIVVEGPPGTGKSHTISSIAFDYILSGKSILILSDTKEALDVVENKIDQTLDKVRGEINIQNPILRLGKMGNTYSKILSRPSMENIRTFHRSQKNDIENVKKEITELTNFINDRIKIETEHYKYIDKEKFEEFFEVQQLIKPSDLVINLDNLNESIRKAGIVLDKDEKFIHTIIDRLHDIEDAEELIDFYKNIWNKDLGKKSLANLIIFLDHLEILEKYVLQNNSNFKSLKLFTKVSKQRLTNLRSLIDEYNDMRGGFLGTLFKGDKITHLSNKVASVVGINKSINLKYDDEKIKKVLDEYSILSDLSKKQNFEIVCKIIQHAKKNDEIKSIVEAKNKFYKVLKFLSTDKLNSEKLLIKNENIETLYSNIFFEFGEDKNEAIKKYYEMEEFFSKSFNIKDRFDYTKSMQKLQSLHTSKMASELDGKLINFYDKQKNSANAIRQIIKAKQKFPRTQFDKLKTAFPCIISSVRDFAEYINLQKDLFDLIIVDEASQVSIAQAFPAIIRAKKVLVLGDRKQYSNLQSSQATTLINNSYMNGIKKVFKKNISGESDKLIRLQNFNVRTSILDFFENISNLSVRLRKHFRGYPEHIEYCSKTFYNSDLQAIRLRTKPINEIIKFDILDYDAKEEQGNINFKEADLIIKYLEKLKKQESKSTVAIITPFTDQQRHLTTKITKHPDRDYFFENLNLIIKTFDTSQGEEREIVFYSMVDSKNKSKLNTIFPVDLSKKDLEENSDKRAQRLNVGFSRVQELMHIITSKPLDKIDGEIGNALRFINNLTAKDKLPTSKDVDPKSPMEKKVIEWFKKTSFYMQHKKYLEMRAQFPLGETLKQLDPDYGHPKFIVDFLVIFSNSSGNKNVIIEYDGLKDHFDSQELVTDGNFEDFYSTNHYEREKALETYGYNFIRLNKFNTADDPVKFLDRKLKEAFQSTDRLNVSQYKTIETFKKTKEGEMKHCERCNKSKPREDFYDKSLSSGLGVVCRSCKGLRGKILKKPKRKSKTSKPKIKLVEGKTYDVSYVNLRGEKRDRELTIKSITGNHLKAYDSLTNEVRNFNIERITLK